MYAFEFQATPENGRIKIPAEYKDKIVGTVRVIVLSQEPSMPADHAESKKTGSRKQGRLV